MYFEVKCTAFVVSVLGVFAKVKVNDEVKERAEKLMNTGMLDEAGPELFARPIRILRECLRNTYKDRLLSLPIEETFVTTTRCIYTDVDGNPEVTPPIRERRAVNPRRALSKCICQVDESLAHYHCHFDLLTTEYNSTILEHCLGNHTETQTARLTYRSKEFHCRLRKNFTVNCRIKQSHILPNDTLFQMTLVCLSNALEPMVCDASQVSPPTTRHETTSNFSLTSPSVSAAQTGTSFLMSLPGLVIMSLAAVLGLLIGIIGTVCCVVCYRNKRKRRKELAAESIVKRTGRRATANSYADDMGASHLYEDLPDTNVPDLLQQGSSQGVHSRFGSQPTVFFTQQSVTYKPGPSSGGYYEPLVRDDNGDVCMLPFSKPVPPPRRDVLQPLPREPDSNDYLDLVDDPDPEQTTDIGRKRNGPTYFVLEDQKPSTNHERDSDYVKIKELETGEKPDNTYHILEERSNADGKETATAIPNLSSSSSETDDSSDEKDGYETPVTSNPGFDIATSFKIKARGLPLQRQTTTEYESLSTVAEDAGPATSTAETKTNDYFVLESTVTHM